ncbi:MAG: gliding motility-associated C-terminal domain-containing protein [Flavobacteriales bacterium]|jgi:gliding motility-associated-like protein
MLNLKRHSLFLILVFILHTPIFFGQLQNNNWIFGYGARVNFSGPIPVGSSNAAINSNESTASVSDPSTGQLLFYTDGRKVWNTNNQIMPNGANLLGGFFNSCTQGALIVPFPEDNQRYYLFTLEELEAQSVNPLADNGLRYSIVDMTLNGGLGDVQVTTMNTPLATDLTEKLIVIRSNEIQGFWVIAHKKSVNEFLAWKIDACGVSTQPIVSAVGSFFSVAEFGATEGWMGAMDASPDGNRIGMTVDWSDRLEFFDFNKTTGVVSNLITVNVTDDSNPPFLRKYGACFSPDGSKFYYTNINSVYQLNLSTYTSAAIASSNTLIYSPTLEPNNYPCFQIEQAPNNKLYVAIGNTGRLDEISNPNSLGLACGYVSNAISFSPATCQLGLPAQVPLGGFAANSTITFFPDSCLQSDISFSIATASPIIQINWNFDDPISGANNSSSSLNPSHLFSETGIYQITATVEFDCFTETVTQNINLIDCLDTLSPDVSFEFPNVITPNGDGINDLFEIQKLPEKTEVIILNRWGNVVFKSDNYQNNWDGKDSSGKELVDGVYTYKFKTQDAKIGHGFVHLVR